MRSVIAVLLMMVLGAKVGWAGEPSESTQPAGWGVKQLMQSLAQVKGAKRKFTERKYMSVLTEPLESSGTLVYIAPGRLEKHTLSPREESMVVEHGVVVITNKAKHMQRTVMLQDYPAVSAFIESIRSTLAGDLESLNKVYQVKLGGDVRRWHLQLVPNDAGVRDVVREIRISGHDNWLGSVEIIEASGDRSVMMVTEDTQ